MLHDMVYGFFLFSTGWLLASLWVIESLSPSVVPGTGTRIDPERFVDGDSA